MIRGQRLLWHDTTTSCNPLNPTERAALAPGAVDAKDSPSALPSTGCLCLRRSIVSWLDRSTRAPQVTSIVVSLVLLIVEDTYGNYTTNETHPRDMKHAEWSVAEPECPSLHARQPRARAQGDVWREWHAPQAPTQRWQTRTARHAVNAAPQGTLAAALQPAAPRDTATITSTHA